MRTLIYKKRRGEKGFSLVEMIIAMLLFTLVGIAEVSLIIITARTQSRGFVEARVFKHADYVQDRITDILRGASRDAGVFFDEPQGAHYRKIVFREGVGMANESLEYDPDEKELIYDPNIYVPNDEMIISYENDSVAQLDEVLFRAGMKTGGIPDSSIILVEMQVSDHGKGRGSYRDPSDQANWIISRRNFAVGLRRQ